MNNSSIKRFVVLFIIFPSFIGGYVLFLGSIEEFSNFNNNNDNDNEELVNELELVSNNQQANKDRSDINYKPIESTLNWSSTADSVLDQVESATDTVEYDLRTGSEKVSSKNDKRNTTISSIVEPFEGIVDADYMIGRPLGVNEGGLKASYVFPPDDRQEITDTTLFPWRSICKLYIEAQDSSHYIGSGAIVDEFHVLTVGHCVYIHDAGGWVEEIIVVPGMDGFYEPYGVAYATNMRTYQGWIQSEMVEHDWALLTLDRSIGNLTGWMGRQTEPSSSSVYTGTLNTAGYPGDLDFGEVMYFCSDDGERADEYNHWFWMDTAGGQSGSPIWRYDGNNRYILSILAYEYLGGIDANFGTRLNTDKYDQLNAWLAEDSNSTVVEDRPDLLDRGLDSGVSRTDLIKGETFFEISCEVANEGTTAASSFDVSFFLSNNTVITEYDYFLGNFTINSLDPYTYADVNWSGVSPSDVPNDFYYVGWIIDSGEVIDEFDENNNNGFINYPLVEIESPPPPDYRGIVILVIISVALVSLVSLTGILIAVRRRGRWLEERSFNEYQAQPYTSPTPRASNNIEQSGLKFCANCRYLCLPNAKFCMNCGYKFHNVR